MRLSGTKIDFLKMFQKEIALEYITNSKNSPCSPGEVSNSSYNDVALTDNKTDCRHIR